MYLKALPYVIVISIIVSFFITPEGNQEIMSAYRYRENINPLLKIFLAITNLPLWSRIISLLVGIVWIIILHSDKHKPEEL